MFDLVCILLAFYLYRRVWRDDESIAFWMLCFFAISEIVYSRFALEFRAENNWAIYWIYNGINLFVMYKLKVCAAHLVSLVFIGLNILLNIVASFYFISNIVPEAVYNYYPYPAGFIMVACLTYLWALGHGARRIDSLDDNSGFISTFFRRGSRLDKSRFL